MNRQKRRAREGVRARERERERERKRLPVSRTPISFSSRLESSPAQSSSACLSHVGMNLLRPSCSIYPFPCPLQNIPTIYFWTPWAIGNSSTTALQSKIRFKLQFALLLVSWNEHTQHSCCTRPQVIRIVRSFHSSDSNDPRHNDTPSITQTSYSNGAYFFNVRWHRIQVFRPRPRHPRKTQCTNPNRFAFLRSKESVRSVKPHTFPLQIFFISRRYNQTLGFSPRIVQHRTDNWPHYQNPIHPVASTTLI